jgi:hypothetical protein
MARPTDTERGARIALEIAIDQEQQLFPGELSRPFWTAIADEAAVTISECAALRAAQGDRA